MCPGPQRANEIKGVQADRKVCSEGFELKIKTLYFKLTSLRRKLLLLRTITMVFRPCFSIRGHVHCFTCTSFTGVFFPQFLAEQRWEATYILFYTVTLQDLAKSSYLYSFCQHRTTKTALTHPLLHIPSLHNSPSGSMFFLSPPRLILHGSLWLC